MTENDRDAQTLDPVYEDFRDAILPFATGNIHPGFVGWVHGSGTPTGMLAELLAAGMNSNLGGRDHGAIYVERQVIAWCRELFGFPADSSGLLVTGTSMANLIGVVVARTAAMEVAGLGTDSLRLIPLDAERRIDLLALERAIEKDRSAGATPFLIVGTAGAVATAPPYLARFDRGSAAGTPWFADYGPDLSRGFRALKVWFTWREHGTSGLGAAMLQNCNQAAALAAGIDDADDLELLARVTLNIVCFRYRRAGLDESALNWLNKELLADTQESGVAVPASTLLDGRFAIRVNLTNHRTRMADLHGLLTFVRSRGAVLAERWLASA